MLQQGVHSMSNVRTQMEKCEVEISGEEKNARPVICILRLRHFNQLLYMMVCTCVRVCVCAKHSAFYRYHIKHKDMLRVSISDE